MLKTRLELRGGFEVLAAEDSEKGCRLAVTEHPDVILMDLEMPDDDRWEAVRRLKNDPQTQNIPIIGMSAHAVESEREKGHRHRVRRVRCQTDRIREPCRDHPARARAPQIDVPTRPGQDGAPLGRRTVKTDPLPASLATVTSPPIMRASLRVMARPSPVPPKR